MTRISYGYHGAPSNLTREQRLTVARVDGQARFPKATNVVATLDPDAPATGPILVEVTIKDSDTAEYYR